MAYVEKTQKSWGSRLSSAFAGLIAGLVLFAGGTWLLYYNEGRSVATGDAIAEAQLASVELPDVARPAPEFEGKMVHATGMADTDDTLTDTFSGLRTTAISLERQVEYYQWVEHSKTETRKKMGGGEEKVTTYTYSQEWKSGPVNSSGFRDPQYVNKNSVLTTVQPETTYAKNVTFGAYLLPPFIVHEMSSKVPASLNLTRDDLENLNSRTFPNASGQSYVHAQNNVIYLGLSPSSPQIGDVRVTLTEVKPAVISILAKVIRDTFEPFRASNGNTFSRVSMGTVGAGNMFGDAISDSTMLTWALRGVGVVLVMIALGLFMMPLSVFADFIPLAGSIVGAGTGLVAFLLGLAWSLVIIAVAWLRFRPLIGGGLLALAAVLVLLLCAKGRKKRTAAV